MVIYSENAIELLRLDCVILPLGAVPCGLCVMTVWVDIPVDVHYLPVFLYGEQNEIPKFNYCQSF